MGIGDWGFGDWGLGIGPNPQSPIPNPQSPIPNPQYLFLVVYCFNFKINIIIDLYNALFYLKLPYIYIEIFLIRKM